MVKKDKRERERSGTVLHFDPPPPPGLKLVMFLLF